MAWLLALPLILAWLVARRLLGERDTLTAASLVLPLGVALTLLGVNGVYRVADLPQAVLGTLAGMALVSALVVLLARAPSSRRPGLHPGTLVFLVLAGLAIYLYTNSQQIANPDDDYWIHMPLQGLMLHGGFPPTNPFFSDVPMNGHYGRNLTLVTVAWLSGLDLPFVQVLMTDLCQLATFLLLFTTLRRQTRSELQAVLGTAFVFFGINVGGRGGLLDTVQNNNAVVHLGLVLNMHLVLRTWGGGGLEPESAAWRENRGRRGGSGCKEGVHRGAERSWRLREHRRGAPDDADGPGSAAECHGRWRIQVESGLAGRVWSAVLGGLVLGGYAIVYETHFGLVILATLSTAALLVASRLWAGTREVASRAPLDGRALLLTGLLLALATPLAVTQGGPLTELFQRKVLGRGGVDVASLSKGMLNQAQFVKIQVPKEKLFQILLEHGEYQRISFVYRTRTFLKRFYSPSPGRGYRPVWSWDVLKIHWLPLLAAPFSAWVLVRRGHASGLFLGTFGVISFLTPALVDFGPIYESEYFRWQFAAGLGLAGALGVAAGAVFEEFWKCHPGRLGSWQAEPDRIRVLLAPRVLAVAGLVGLVWLETLTCSQFLWDRAESLSGRGQWLRGAWLLPETRAWLARHTVLDFHPADWEVARWLEKRVEPGQRMLMNFREENNFSILHESTFSGLSGVRSVGHALPLDDEPVGTTPFHMAPPARAFWTTLDPSLLRGLRVDWLFLRQDPGEEDLSARLAGLPGLSLAHRTRGGRGGGRWLYRVDLPPLRVGPLVREVSPLRLEEIRLPGNLRNGRGARARVVLRHGGTESLSLREGVLFYETVRQETGKRTAEVERVLQPLDLDLAPGEVRTLEVPFVAPHEDGTYALEFFLGDFRKVQKLAGKACRFAMDFRPRMRALQVRSCDSLDTLKPGRLVRLRFTVANPLGCDFVARDGLLAAVVPVRPQDPPPSLAVAPLAPLGLEIPARGQVDLEVFARLPEQAGVWRMDLVLALAEGGTGFLPGVELVTEP